MKNRKGKKTKNNKETKQLGTKNINRAPGSENLGKAAARKILKISKLLWYTTVPT